MSSRVYFVSTLVLWFMVSGCTEPTSSSKTSAEATTPVAFNTAGAPTIEFTVPDMMCPEGCGAKVKEILSQQPGAKDVLVDFPNKTAIVAIDKGKFDFRQAVAALKDHQFNHSALKDANATVTSSTSPVADAKSVQ